MHFVGALILEHCFFGGISSLASALDVPKVPLHTQGRYVVDRDGVRVKLACTNWYGAHSRTFAQNGLSKSTLPNVVSNIAGLGFNCVRLSYSLEAYADNPRVRPEYISRLANTTNRHFLDLFDEVVTALTGANIMVIINNHNTYAGWCCTLTDRSSLWFNREYPEHLWIESLQGLARRYRNNPLVIGFDLRNEVRSGYFHGAVESGTIDLPVWGDSAATLNLPIPFQVSLWDWRGAAERAGAAVLQESPDVLIIVELPYNSAVLCPSLLKRYPLRGLDGHVVWSPHDYPWLDMMRFASVACKAESTNEEFIKSAIVQHIRRELMVDFLGVGVPSIVLGVACALPFLTRIKCGGRGSCFLAFVAVAMLGVLALTGVFWAAVPHRPINSYEDFASVRDASYGYLAINEIGPVWVAEFGEDTPSLWWNYVITYLRERDLDFAYWSFDGEHFPEVATTFAEDIPGLSQDETYGLLEKDYQTVRHEWKLRDLQSLMSPKPHNRDELPTSQAHGGHSEL